MGMEIGMDMEMKVEVEYFAKAGVAVSESIVSQVKPMN